jgi:hypothetical protein
VGHRINKKGNQKVPGSYEYEITTYQDVWDIVKAVLRGKFNP